MVGLPNVIRILACFNPCGIFICYAVLFVVRAEENTEDSTQRRAFERPTREVLGKRVAEENIQPLRDAEWCNGTACEGVIPYNGNDNNCSHQRTHIYIELYIPTVIKGKWYYPKRNELVFSILLSLNTSLSN